MKFKLLSASPAASPASSPAASTTPPASFALMVRALVKGRGPSAPATTTPPPLSGRAVAPARARPTLSAAERDTARTEGASETLARWRAVFDHEAAHRHPTAAAALASDPDVTVGAAHRILAQLREPAVRPAAAARC